MELDHEMEIVDDEYMVVDDEDTTDADDDVQPMGDQREDISASLPCLRPRLYRRLKTTPLPPASTLPSPAVIEAVMGVEPLEAAVAAEQPRTTVVDEELQSMIVFKELHAIPSVWKIPRPLTILVAEDLEVATISLPPSPVLHIQGIIFLEYLRIQRPPRAAWPMSTAPSITAHHFDPCAHYLRHFPSPMDPLALYGRSQSAMVPLAGA
ncbi:uncharacterized protein BXZ73DRAFT_101209 [Epithele typhae]|uniref:uncharacterized protein n=1 Tax=Epithele typhae TaxID=378194 RepID=UPI002008BEF3|nr:uncharacterized protein BXZ73DRAFT_101209 [Epithele typhae]KAH9933249.1 hypothetical protein BXZ73DRAFT_101209 [Epithele typhae]